MSPYPGDLTLPRVGVGYDSHIFGADRPLILGGVFIEHTSGLKGHSDGDALCHAIIDALLGAAAMGDIGTFFPATDEHWKDADSLQMLADVRRRLEAANYEIINVDATVIAEEPRLASHIVPMRQNIASALGVDVEAVSVKAKTNEGMDAVGRGDGIIVFAIASVGGS